MTMIKEHHDEKPQTPFEGLPRPEKGPLNAAEVGYSYHLIVRGYDDADEPDLETFVRRFLRILFGDNNANCPVKYGFHSIIPDASNQSRKILRLSLNREERITSSPTLENALRVFAKQFFSVETETCDRACRTLSEYGMYGFSPEEESMKISWYEAMFFWMKDFRKDKMSNLEQNLRAISRSKGISSWFPSWTGAALFALSIGAASILSAVNTNLPGASMFNVAPIDAMLVFIGVEKEKEGVDIKKAAKDRCSSFLRQVDETISGMKEQPTTQRPLASIARSMTVRLVNLFEMGFETVTTCRKAVEIFVEIKKKNVLATGLNFARLCFSAYNLGVVAELAADASITVPTSVGLAAGAQVIASLGQIAFCAYNAKQAHKEQQKWSKVAVLVASSVRHGQYCEVYLRWIYNSSTGNGPQQGSSEYTQLLASLMEQMNMTIPTPQECTDTAVRGRLEGYALTLEHQRREIEQML